RQRKRSGLLRISRDHAEGHPGRRREEVLEELHRELLLRRQPQYGAAGRLLSADVAVLNHALKRKKGRLVYVCCGVESVGLGVVAGARMAYRAPSPPRFCGGEGGRRPDEGRLTVAAPLHKQQHLVIERTSHGRRAISVAR